jgi:hypothetical protein
LKAPAVQTPQSKPAPSANPSPSGSSKEASATTTPAGMATTTKPTPTKAPPSPNTAPGSPTFRTGQWIAVIDSYPTDGVLPADQAAIALAHLLDAGGIPAKALAATGQYRGLIRGDGQPIRDAWIVYVGPAGSSAAARALCASNLAQKLHSSPACPTYEPAAAPGS